jgi:hypothetical protein
MVNAPVAALSGGWCPVEEEVHDVGRRTDEQGGQARDQNGSPADHRLLEVLGVHAQGPGGGADHQADQGGDQGPGPEAVDQRLQGAAASSPVILGA